MGNKEKGPGRKPKGGRVVGRIAALLAVVALCALAWGYLQPLLTADAIVTYGSAVAEKGSITTTMSLSATISVRYQEILTNSTVTTVSKIDVEEGAEVKSGDKILELANGEVLSASMSGTVNEIAVSVGDYLWRTNRQLAQICDLTQLEVDLTVDEYDIRKVQLGQKCTVSIISLGQDFETEIAHIDYVSASAGTVAYYSVKAYLTVPEEVLPGMAATVTLPAEEKTDVLTLDVSALSFHDDGSAYVLLQQSDGTYKEQDVETGLSDGMKVEITSGLTEGQEVWVVTGHTTSESELTLSALYKKLFGETVVINPENTRGSGKSSGGWSGAGMGTPTDLTGTGAATDGWSGFNGTPTDLGEMPEGDIPEGAVPEGGMPEGGMPEGMTPPDGTMPEGLSFPDSSGEAAQTTADTAEQTAAAEDAAATTSPSRGERPDKTGGGAGNTDGTGTRPERPQATESSDETEGGAGA